MTKQATSGSAVRHAVIYARVSTDEQAKGYSLPTQLSECHKYAETMNYQVTAEFKDDYTGASIDRPGLNSMREYLRVNGTEVVIVYDLDRLARKSVYQMLIEEELRKQGITVEYVNGQYADTDEGRLQKQIKSSIAEYEKAKILERSKRGKRGKAQSGFAVVGARAPYGYQIKSEPHKTWLVIDKSEARVVRLVYQWYLYGDRQHGPLSILGIAARLTQMGILTRGDKDAHVAKKRGTGVWSGGMIRHILTNETYTGTWHYGKTKMTESVSVKRRSDHSQSKRGFGKQVARPREEWIAVNVPAVIGQAAFDKVQKRLAHNKEQAKRSTKYKYLLGRRLKCIKCGYSYVGKTRREKHQYYYCKGKEQKPVSLCDMPLFRVDEVDDAVWKWIKWAMQNPDKLVEGLHAEQATTERENRALYERLELIQEKLLDSEKRRSKILDLYLNNDFAKDELQERKTQIESTITDLLHEQAEISEHIQKTTVTDEQIAQIEATCAEVREGLGHATFDDKRRYFELLDVRGKLAIETNEKVVYIKCKMGEQRLSLVPTSP